MLFAIPPRHGLPGIGTAHHVAFRITDDAAQRIWRDKLVELGHNVSPVKDRAYFHSICYPEPGGMLFEIATDAPGFAVDESLEALGSSLRLPGHFEPLRSQIEKRFPMLTSASS